MSMSHVTYQWVTSYMSMSHVTGVNKSYTPWRIPWQHESTNKQVMSMSHVIYQWVTSHINESRHTFQRVMSLVSINHTHHGVFSDNSSPRTGREPKATPARHKHPQHQHKPKNEIQQTPCRWHISCGANDFLCTDAYSRKSVRSIYCTRYHVSLLYKITTQLTFGNFLCTGPYSRKWAMSCMHNSYHVWMSRGTYRWVMSHINDFVCTGGYSRKSAA